MANILILYQFILIFAAHSYYSTSIDMSEFDPPSDEISSVGEFGLISHLTRDICLINPSTRVGVGDGGGHPF
jgi:hypothetical protein